MLLYIGVALWPLLIGYLAKTKRILLGEKPLSKNVYIIIAMLPMFLLIGFRSGYMGADTGTYHRNFLYIAQTPMKEILAKSRMEEGYLYFVKIISFFTKSPLVFQLIYTSIYAIAFFVFMQTLDDNWAEFLFFVCTLGLYTFMFTGVRQCLAMSICLISYRFVIKKKLIPFILLVLLAYTFHHSAILFIVVYFVVQREVKWYNILLYGVLLYVAVMNLSDIQNWFNDQLDYNYEIEETGSGIIFLALLTILVVFSTFVLSENKKIDTTTKPLLNLSFITLFFWILRLQTRVAERPSYYFMFFVCAAIVYALNSIKDPNARFYIKSIIIFVCLALYVYRFSTNFISFIPYEFYWG